MLFSFEKVRDYIMYRLDFIFVLLLSCSICSGFLNIYGPILQYPINDNVGKPLFLTPLIKAGYLDRAKAAAKVTPLVGDVESYSGYLTVDDKYYSNLFFWFFVTKPDAPVVLWLQGGPGGSSLFGLFAENGPFIIDQHLNVSLRKYSWTNSCSVLYIDNPVGTGYSFTSNEEGYARNEIDVAKNLYTALLQFFTLFSDLQKNEFFITGESYAGKYVPAISYMIHKMNPSASLKINLQGLAIGNGLCDPEHMLLYGEYLYELGLIDKNAKYAFYKKELEILTNIKQQKWLEAYKGFDSLIGGDVSATTLFKNLTGITNYYNYLDEGQTPEMPINKFIQQAHIRKNIHVGNIPFSDGLKVQFHLQEDILKSVANWVELLIENYKILIYNGQLDIIVAYPLTLGFLNNLKWSGADLYKTTPRKIWKVNNLIAGYSKTVKNFTEVLVRGAGHMVPTDQPVFALDLIDRFVFHKSF